MKPAERWAEENYSDLTYPEVVAERRKFTLLAKQIQIDALNHACNVCDEGYQAFTSLGSKAAAIACTEVKANIESEIKLLQDDKNT